MASATTRKCPGAKGSSVPTTKMAAGSSRESVTCSEMAPALTLYGLFLSLWVNPRWPRNLTRRKHGGNRLHAALCHDGRPVALETAVPAVLGPKKLCEFLSPWSHPPSWAEKVPSAHRAQA
ncbi:Hypothetical predicted protein [Podarcis lilfordi]|uniref:Uncharacterized protein n=1 Tax=Podarcis lilfordi TaxID=74358 RepID=A0AA35LMS9_9SAUR|nr:Hypothetical predicted protein [Podarcis lilfordi]